MKVYIDSRLFDGDEGEGLIPCELAAVTEGGLRLEGDGWSIGCYNGEIYDDQGRAIDKSGLQRAMLVDEATRTLEKLRASGLFEGIDRTTRLMNALLDGLETVPILRVIIQKIREEVQE